jgi:hypothetical protein
MKGCPKKLAEELGNLGFFCMRQGERENTIKWVWEIIGLNVRQNIFADRSRNNSSLCNAEVVDKGGRGYCTGAERPTR